MWGASWRGMEVRTLCVLVTCVQVLGGVVQKMECQEGIRSVQEEFGVDSSHVLDFGGSENLCAPQQENSTSTSPPGCCPSTMVDSMLKHSNVLLSTFNNSEQFDRFKTKISMYETVMLSHESSNVELWNATIEGLKVLRSWGTKYWDPVYLQRNNVFSNECLRRVVQMRVCGACGGREVIVKPCKSLCHNVVLGCIKLPLAEFIESSWKHAVNSVRTAIRLVITTGGDAKQNTQPLQDLVADLNDWREPITWWMPDYKHTASCESLPTSGCWNGESVGKYEFGTATWRSQYNPEFSNVYRGDSGLIQPNVIVELDRFRSELATVRKSLEKYWPTASHSQKSPPHALALGSSESISPPRTYIHDLQETGSGEESYESDDEDIAYGNSGYGPHIPDSDDEDLGGYGSGDMGSGDRDPYLDITSPDTDGISEVNGGSSEGPVSLSCGDTFTPTYVTSFVLVIVYTLLT